jgi:hypothetical protein
MARVKRPVHQEYRVLMIHSFILVIVVLIAQFYVYAAI